MNEINQRRDGNQTNEKACSNCGAVFTCGALAGSESCWCNDLPHISPITQSADDCLCPQCLRAVIAKVTGTEQ